MQEIAIVTGGAQGIGLACAKRLREKGVEIALWDIDETVLKPAASEIGAVPICADISNWASVTAAMEETVSKAGEPSILVNSAGIAGPNAVIEDYPLEDWCQIFDVNTTGSFHMLKAVLPGMKQRNYGRIALIASVAGKEGNPNASAYSASKAAVMALAKSAGKECASFDIAVNAVTPAAARTRIFDQMSKEHIDYMLSKIPRNRFLEVKEAADMIAWLCDRENSFATGAVFDLSGGRATY
ncbi:SDR family NAD(P)-dependent oxidoreductase [uncultured Roseibium sp.]|uniref:SDR family NAD(P)-dependent oxidoreductase n=1 Tax=uncultured Roseibium sp. TaxID=1936171 RepID=UPI0026244AAD|nr:SDR family NAD(P)-dependent oxidoreductase [uncultured Roseibium sp.]